MKILLLEDDARAAGYLVKGLTESGHVCDHIDDGRDALFQVTREAYDLFIVDRMTPGLDGLSVVKSARAAGVATPVLFLTADFLHRLGQVIPDGQYRRIDLNGVVINRTGPLRASRRSASRCRSAGPPRPTCAPRRRAAPAPAGGP